jgi:hypothetical protein
MSLSHNFGEPAAGCTKDGETSQKSSKTFLSRGKNSSFARAKNAISKVKDAER